MLFLRAHYQILSGVLFCWSMPEKVVFRCGQTFCWKHAMKFVKFCFYCCVLCWNITRECQIIDSKLQNFFASSQHWWCQIRKLSSGKFSGILPKPNVIYAHENLYRIIVLHWTFPHQGLCRHFGFSKLAVLS